MITWSHTEPKQNNYAHHYHHLSLSAFIKTNEKANLTFHISETVSFFISFSPLVFVIFTNLRFQFIVALVSTQTVTIIMDILAFVSSTTAFLKLLTDWCEVVSSLFDDVHEWFLCLLLRRKVRESQINIDVQNSANFNSRTQIIWFPRKHSQRRECFLFVLCKIGLRWYCGDFGQVKEILKGFFTYSFTVYHVSLPSEVSGLKSITFIFFNQLLLLPVTTLFCYQVVFKCF